MEEASKDAIGGFPDETRRFYIEARRRGRVVAEVFLAALVAFVAALLAVVTFVAYARSRLTRVLFVALGLAVFAAKGVWETAALVAPARFAMPSLAIGLVADLAIVALLYLAVLAPAKG